MSRFFVEPSNISNDQIQLKETEVHHLRDVLRFQVGDEVVAFDGLGHEFKCQVDFIDKKECQLTILEKLPFKKEPLRKVSLAHCVTKGERFDWVVEKGTELGLSEIIPFTSQRMAMILNQEGKKKKSERWHRLSQAASKQSGRVHLPKIEDILSFSDMIDLFPNFGLVLLAYELENKKEIKTVLRSKVTSLKEKEPYSILAVVGPEGGFTDSEVKEMIQKGAESVSIGENILRTETAAMAMTAMIQYELMDEDVSN